MTLPMMSGVTRCPAGDRGTCNWVIEMNLAKGLFANVQTDERKSRGSNYQLPETDREGHPARAVTFRHVSCANLVGRKLKNKESDSFSSLLPVSC